MDEKKTETGSTSASHSQSSGQVPAEVILQQQIEHRFSYHQVDEAGTKAIQEIREACKACALIIAARTKIGRDQSSALTHLDLAMFHANASIARKGK